MVPQFRKNNVNKNDQSRTQMTAFKSDFLSELQWRGFIHQASDAGGIDALAARGEIVAYLGYDCTSPSLHIGHLISAIILHWLQEKGGGKPITFFASATTQTSTPSG